MAPAPEDYTSLARQTAREVVKELNEMHQRCRHCSDAKSIARHERDHEFIGELIDLFRRIRETKWTVIKAVATAIVFTILGIIGFKLK